MGKNNSKDLVSVDYWLEEDGLLLIEGWSRDGYSFEDIATKIGIDKLRLIRWKDRYPEIADAMRKGKELIDYQVENALLKSALGYKTKEVKVTTTMRYGKVVETIKEVTDKEVAPNVSAIQMWLYNRQRDKWKNMNAAKNILEDMEEDSSFEIVVTRATKNESGSDKSAVDENEEDFDNPIEDKEITVRKRTKEEAKKVKKEKKKKAAVEKANTVVDDEDESQDIDLDAWPDDWSDDEE